MMNCVVKIILYLFCEMQNYYNIYKKQENYFGCFVIKQPQKICKSAITGTVSSKENMEVELKGHFWP